MCKRIRRLFLVILLLLHQVRGFTPNPRSSIHRTPLTQRWSFNPFGNAGGHNHSGGGGGGNKRNNPFFSGFDDADDNHGPCNNLPYILGGGGAWLWAHVSNAKSSYSGMSSQRVVLAGPSTGTLTHGGNLKFLLAAALFVLQAVSLQTAQVCASVARQGTTWYLAQLRASPLITKSVTSGILGVCGDYMAQWLEYRLGRRRSGKDSSASSLSIYGTYDARRGIAILLENIFLSGPLMHWGYNFFERVVPITEGRSLAAMAHVVADSLVLDSVFVGTAIVATGLVEGYRLKDDIVPQLQRDYPDALKASWATSTVLMPLEFVCFRYLPVTFRVLAMNLTDIIWDGVISFMAHKSRQHDDTPMTLHRKEVETL